MYLNHPKGHLESESLPGQNREDIILNRERRAGEMREIDSP
jgi:hypothetical protein